MTAGIKGTKYDQQSARAFQADEVGVIEQFGGCSTECHIPKKVSKPVP